MEIQDISPQATTLQTKRPATPSRWTTSPDLQHPTRFNAPKERKLNNPKTAFQPKVPLLHSINSPWTSVQDSSLLLVYKREFNNLPTPYNFWSRVANYIPGKSPSHCKSRFINVLDPTFKRGKFTKEEDQWLVERYFACKGDWKEVMKGMESRTMVKCKARFKVLSRSS